MSWSLSRLAQNAQDNGEDAERQRVSASSKTLAQRWNALMEEEKDALTAERVKELEERRKDRVEGIRNVPLSAFQDMCITFTKVYEELANLHTRTGTEILLLGVRGSLTSYNKPAIYYSNDRIRNFFETLAGSTLLHIGIRMEAFCIGGAEKMIQNQQQQTLLLKSQLAGLILSKLQAACRRGDIKKMNYAQFDAAITTKHGVIKENWLIDQFVSPSNMTHLEAKVTLRAFESGTARFRSLSDEEWRDW
ncbi:hypothetical protein C8Q80DRAFT_1105313, partial [Daedaleopsis nitida]